MKIAIVGGCFTCQHNIPEEKLYHQTLKKLLLQNGIEAEIRTIRYDRVSKCLDKIELLRQEFDFDLLIFHLRAEPFMRMAKFYYKYNDAAGKLRHSFNLPFLNLYNPEKTDFLTARRANCAAPAAETESRVHYYLKEANYYLGSLIGNRIYAFRLFRTFLSQLDNYCTLHNTSLLVTGSVARLTSRFESQLTKTMDSEFGAFSEQQNIAYLSLLSGSTESMFFPNKIHVSQAGHDKIALSIFRKLTESAAVTQFTPVAEIPT